MGIDVFWNNIDSLKQGDNTNNHIPDPAPTPPSHSYAVRILTRDQIDDWKWHPALMTRIAGFCNEYEEQADPLALVRNLQQAFVMDDPGLIVLAFFRDGDLIGHMLCDRAVLYYKPIVTVHQYKLDHGIPNEIRQQSIELVEGWAKDKGPNGTNEPATFIQWVVREKKLAHMYKRAFGAKPHALLMRRKVKE